MMTSTERDRLRAEAGGAALLGVGGGEGELEDGVPEQQAHEFPPGVPRGAEDACGNSMHGQ